MDTKKLVREIRKELSSKMAVKKVYLFGSRARGTFHDDSDYDIAIISQAFRKISFLERQKMVRPIIRKVLGDVSLDVACYTQEEFDAGKKAFLPSVIIKEGIAA